MTSRQQIVDETLTWLNTPYHHHQCVKGVGVDCAQLLIGVGKAVGFLGQDFRIDNYANLARGSYLIRHIEHHLISTDKALHGDIVLIRFSSLDTHVGIVVSNSMFVHASATMGKVCYGTLSDYQVTRIFAVPGVIDG